MKILIYIPQLTVGGTEKHVAWLSKMLKDDNEVFLWVKEKGGYWYDEIKKNGIPIIYWEGSSYLMKRFSIIKKLINIGTIDIFHSFGYADHFYDIFILKALKTSNIIKSTRNMRHWDIKKKITILERMRNSFVKYHFVNSKSVLNNLMYIENIQANQIITIPNPINPPNNNNKIIKLNKSKSTFGIIMIANFKPVKNNIESLYIFKKLLKKITSNITLTLVGKGESKTNCKNWAIKNKISEKIIFLDLPPSKVNNIICKSDLYLSTSISEGSSNALMESLSLGLPFVATKTGSSEELIKLGFDGSVYDQGDIGYASELIYNYVLASKKQSQKTRKKNINLTKTYFNEKIIYKKYLKSYNRVLSK